MRRAVRWFFRGVLLLLALVLVLGGAVVVAVHTDWGREQLRGRIEAALDARFRGDVHIGRLEGSPFGELTLVDVTIDGPDGGRAITVDRLHADLALRPLLRGELRFRWMALEGLDVRGHRGADGVLDLTELMVPATEPAGWDIVIEQLHVPGARVEITGVGRPLVIDDLTVVGSLEIPRAKELQARLSAADAVIGSALISVRNLAVDGTDLRADASVRLPPQAIAEWAPGSPLRPHVLLLVHAEPVDGVTRFDLAGTATGDGGLDASLAGQARLDRGVVTVDGLRVAADVADLGALLRDGPAAGGTLHVAVVARGRFGGGQPPSFAVDGEAHGQRLRLERWSAAKLDATVRAHQLPGDPAGWGRIDVRGVARDGRPVGRLEVDARSRPDGAIAVSVISRPPTAPWRIDLDALVRVGDGAVAVALGEHRIRTHGVDWHGRGGRITVDRERVTVADLVTRIAGGRLTVAGSYRRAGARQGDLELRASATALELEEVARSLELPPGMRGQLDASVAVDKRGAVWSGRIGGGGTGLAVRADATPVDVRVDAALTPRRVAVDLDVRGGGVDHVAAQVDVDPPRDYLDPAAWQRLPRRAIQRGRISITNADLAELARTAGVAPRVRGRLDGSLVLTRDDVTGRLQGRGLTLPGLREPVDVAARLQREDARIVAAELDATVRGLASGTATARIAIPARPFDLSGWARMDAESIQSATAVIPDLRIDAALSRRLGLKEHWYGGASLAIEVGPGLHDALAQVELRRLRSTRLRTPIDANLSVRAGVDGLDADASVYTGGAHVTATGHAPVTLDALWVGRAPLLREAPLTGQVELEPTPAAKLLALTGRREPLVGTVSADVRIAGTVAAPTGRAELLLRELGIDRPTLRQLRATATWDGALLRATVRGEQRDGGTIAVDATADPTDLEQVKGTLRARGFDLAPLARLAPPRFASIEGRLSSNLTIAGLGRDSADVDGDLRWTGARIPIDARVGTMRQGTVSVVVRDGAVRAKIDGRIGQGTVRVRATGGLRGLVPQHGELAVTVRDVILLAELQPSINARLDATLRRSGDGWVLDGSIRKSRVVIPRLQADPLYAPGTPPDMVIIENGVPPPRTIEPPPAWRTLLGHRPTRPWLRGRITIEPMTVQTEELRGRISGAVTLLVGDDGLLVDGVIAVKEGSLVLFDRRYRVERAELTLAGGANPVVDIQLVHDFPQMTLFVSITGRVKDPDLRLSSRPSSYSEGQLLGFLLGASPGEEGPPQVGEAATGLASSMVSKKIGGYIEGYLPVQLDVLRFRAATASEAASFTVGKWLTRKLFLAYERRIEARPDQNAGEAEIEYWLRPDLLLDAQIGDRGHHELDLLWLDRW